MATFHGSISTTSTNRVAVPAVMVTVFVPSPFGVTALLFTWLSAANAPAVSATHWLAAWEAKAAGLEPFPGTTLRFASIPGWIRHTLCTDVGVAVFSMIFS